MIIGAQLYTLRNQCKDLDSFAESLKKVADIGYTTVQVSGTCPYSPEWLRDQLKQNGLKCVLTHIPVDRLEKEPDTVCEDHRIFECPRIGLGSMGIRNITEENYTGFVARFKPIAEKLAANGMKFFFHNHVSEFIKSENGKTYMERLADDFSPSELQFTLDTYWTQYAGCEPTHWLKKLAGRLECIHLKDMTFEEDARTHRMAPVGFGTMDFPRIITTASDCGVEYLLVEQDNCYEEDPFDCLKKSYDYLKSIGLN